MAILYDTMQRNGSKASHNTKSHLNQHNNNNNSKNDSLDTGISSNNHQHRHHQQIHQHAHYPNAAKQRKSRCNIKRQDGGGNAGGQTKRTTTTRTGYSVNEWLGRNDVYCYDSRFISSCAEDNMMPRHNPAHRNSTSSDAAASDDLNSSSSNEDLSSATYTALTKGQNKKTTKSRQRRQQKRKQQANQQANNNHNNHNNSESPMDIDQDTKENQRPANMQHATRTHGAKNTNENLHKQCTKAAALKVVKNNANNKCNSNTLTTSASNSSVCSTLSSASSTLSIPSSGCSSASNSPSHSANCSPTASPTASKRSKADNIKKIARAFAPPLRQHTKLNLTEQELVQQLRRHVIDPNLLRVFGYPVESVSHEGCVEIFKCLPKAFYAHTIHHHHNQQQTPKSSVINANDGLYANLSMPVPTSGKDKQWSLNDTASHSSADSGHGSSDSSPPSVDSDSSEVGEDESTGTTAFYTPDGTYQIFSQYDQSLEKQCVRCKRAFHVNEAGEYLSREECSFHWGKLNHMYTGSKGFGYQYSCCEGDQSSEGCTRNPLHVWSGIVMGINGPYTDFVQTLARYDVGGDHKSMSSRHTKVYALDCEMSFTGRGLEVTKITVVAYDGQLVYEHYVRPDAEIVDYNTRFSGISQKDLCAHSNNSIKTLSEVQRDLQQLFDADTILIGHGLDNDLRALRLVHKTIIDTSIAFPHASGFPYRRALKHLTKVYLNRDIQCSDAGHSSFEDSRACLELMLWKLRKDWRHEFVQ